VTFREFFYDVLVITVLQSVLSYISGRKRPSVLFTVSTVLSQFTRVTDGRTDRQTDEQTEFSSLYRVCIPCSAVKSRHSSAEQLPLCARQNACS